MKKIEKLMRHWSDYLDFLSVVNGYRDVALIALENRRVVGEKKNNTCRFKPIPGQFTEIKKYLEQHHPGYTIIKGKDCAFITKNNSANKVKSFVKKYDKAKGSNKRDRELGKLLGFPSCCVEELIRPKQYIPFRPCSQKCEHKWGNIYSKLKRKYKVKAPP